MAEQMYIVITIRKPVVDREAGEAVYEIVKTKLAAYTDLAIAAFNNPPISCGFKALPSGPTA